MKQLLDAIRVKDSDHGSPRYLGSDALVHHTIVVWNRRLRFSAPYDVNPGRLVHPDEEQDALLKTRITACGRESILSAIAANDLEIDDYPQPVTCVECMGAT